ncbi:MAG: tRNA threonylcarbamoyladenosine dehydratase [Marinilabiliaceae bacterium]|jgi:tRNA A37 threonylcarbamoyladenosine dehydratase|nr:tRNA threonylcarbamoyladenosine dehydratase [Marinilabiliaceae bacterium]
MSWQARTELLLGKESLDKLASANVLIVGLGGVGAYAAEMICRAGVGRMTIVDGDIINETNINRQLVALNSTLGENKTEVLGKRLLDINPGLQLEIITEFIRDERMTEILDRGYDYVVDAIDTLSPKVFLIYHAMQKGMPVVSSMGAGGKLDPSKIQIADISKTYNCKLAKVLRKRLHRLGIRKGFTAVFSPEAVAGESIELTEGEQNKKSNVGTISYMPPAFGCACASVVIRGLL